MSNVRIPGDLTRCLRCMGRVDLPMVRDTVTLEVLHVPRMCHACAYGPRGQSGMTEVKPNAPAVKRRAVKESP